MKRKRKPLQGKFALSQKKLVGKKLFLKVTERTIFSSLK